MNPCAIVLMIAALSMPVGHRKEIEPSSKGPAIVEVQQKAIEYARLNPSEITSWKNRVRGAALLPQLQLSYGRRYKNDVNVNINDSVYVGTGGVAVGPEQGGVSQTINADQNVEVKAVWRFSEAVFNPDMLAVSEETRLLARERQAVLAEVNKNYYERERLYGEIKFLDDILKKEPRSEKIRQEIILKRVQMDEAGAALDALTGGWFSAQVSPEVR